MEEDVRTVHYATQDDMPNFKLRVTLTRLSATRPRPSTAAVSASTASSAASQPAVDRRQACAKHVRTFTWQEKVYSKAELVMAQAAVRAQHQQGILTMPAGRRTAKLGSQAHVSTEQLKACPVEGSVLFSYVQTDDWCERFETRRSVTTSSWEARNHLARKLAADARNRQQMLNFQSMFIMADLGDETTVAGCNEQVLCVIRAAHDGSFDMTPGFSAPGQRLYHFEDDHGAIYGYSLELASHSSAPSLERRAAKLASSVCCQAEELRRAHAADRLPLPGPDASALRVLLLAELVSAAGFERDRLYLEWQLHYDPQLWVLQHSEQEVVQPGMLQGVTHVSRMVQYPRDPSTDTSALWVAHFAHPIEVEWVARTPPAPKDWPRLFLQVCTHDLWNRGTTEGYGWLQLGPASTSGSSTHYVDTWRPLGTRRDQQRAFFVGGSEELQELASCAAPKDHQSRVLNKYGFKTQTGGNLKVRTHMVLQTGAEGGASPRKTAAAHGVAAAAAAARQRRALSLAVVLERARSRLQEARGGDVVVREGLLVQPPVVTQQPEDLTVNEGSDVQLCVRAVGLLPLRYQWFREGKRLTVATSNAPLLVLVDVAAADSGAYHCQVTNKDGSAASCKALLTVLRVGRLAAAAASASGAASVAGSPQPGALSGLTPARRALATVPRTLPQGDSDRTGLPLSTRFSSTGAAAASGTQSPPAAAPAGSLSPLIRGRPQSAVGRFAPAPAGRQAGEALAAKAGGAAAGMAGDPSSSAAASGAGRLLPLPVRQFAARSRPATAGGAAADAAGERTLQGVAAPAAADGVAAAGAQLAAQSQALAAAAASRPAPQTSSGGWFDDTSSAVGEAAGGEGQPAERPASSGSSQPGLQSRQQLPAGPAAVAAGDPAAGDAAAASSPMRRTRVSEQQ